jgi:hypothetical protein
MTYSLVVSASTFTTAHASRFSYLTPNTFGPGLMRARVLGVVIRVVRMPGVQLHVKAAAPSSTTWPLMENVTFAEKLHRSAK